MLRIAGEMARPKLSLTADANAALQNYSWPGNVRELRNTLERATLLSGHAELDAVDLDFRFLSRTSAAMTTSDTLEDVERVHIQSVLKRCNGEVAAAAKVLGIARTTLYAKIKGYDLQISAKNQLSSDIPA